MSLSSENPYSDGDFTDGVEMPVEFLKYELGDQARSVVETTMREAESSGIHTPGSWRREGDAHHLTHVVEHIASYMAGDASERHLAHAITRLAMALWCSDHGVIGDFGVEGEGR